MKTAFSLSARHDLPPCDGKLYISRAKYLHSELEVLDLLFSVSHPENSDETAGTLHLRKNMVLNADIDLYTRSFCNKIKDQDFSHNLYIFYQVPKVRCCLLFSLSQVQK